MKIGGYWQLSVRKMQHYRLCALCDLGYANEKISGTFIERLLVETLPVDGHALNSLCTFKSTVTRSYKRLTLPDLSLLLPTTLSNGGFSGLPTNS